MIRFIAIFFFISFASANFEERRNLSFQIKAIYKNDIDSMMVYGNGLGLSETEGIPMSKSDDGSWLLEVRYAADWKGFRCMNCSAHNNGFIPNGDDLKITLSAIQGMTETSMVGSPFRISLPVSKVSEFFEEQPVHILYPYFFRNKGEFRTLTVDSQDDTIGTRDMVVYLPPGASENRQPVYDVYYIIDFGPNDIQWSEDMINQIFNDGIAKDSIIIGYGDFRFDPATQDTTLDRNLQLTSSVGAAYVCKEGSFYDQCNYCLPEYYTEEELIYYFVVMGCGTIVPSGGNADANVDFLLTTVFENVDEFLKDNYGTHLSRDREDTFIIGFSHGGLFACHAAWTRPQRIGSAACQSSTFSWPFKVEGLEPRTDFYFINETLKTHLNDRLPQKILIDVGALENADVYHMVEAAQYVFETLASNPMFDADHNLWYNVYPGQSHSSSSWLGRLWTAFTVLSNE